MNSSLIRVAVTTNRMTGVAWTNGRLRDVIFRDCRLDLTRFRSTTAANVLFEGCNLKQADFQDADLRGVTFEDCDLTSAQFSGAKMDGARLLDCVLVGVNGVTSMAGAGVASRDMVALAYSLAGALGITVLDEE
nr:pentapeptide repeat-containing protein [Parafrankia sp. CH37]